MRIKMALMVTILALLSACVNSVDKENLAIHVNNDTTTSSPNSSSMATEAKREDNSIRAIGTNQDGRLLVKPASQANVATLGASSCLGVDSDLRWLGDYEMLWEPTSGGASRKVMTFPIDFEIVQPSDVPVKMQKFTLGTTDLFAYVPRYTDCHALETYLFGINGGKAFPITFEMKPGQIWTNIGQLPHHPFQVSNGELTITGGYAAGQDFIDVYHFYYDSKKHSMILKKTDQVKPNDLTGSLPTP
ncbi:hypothetical protein [Paenibacillus durus]|uniref:Lipoprotein n=1 Tax=Paenibacillus durus ATCC 35681 TaxID=1333534 RepID=A0A0F7F7F6_PAEDU|nr:hypothetical protein [Paenibacillus durus]AKG33953.1 hypothetical protein VK70_04645 [Paenibacillus durus ATCC 35681]